MRVYRMEADLAEKNVTFLGLLDHEAFMKFDKELRRGLPVSDAFRFVELERDKSDLRETEFMDCSQVWITTGIVLFNQKAKDCLEGVFGDYVEFVPAKYQDDIYYIVNVLNIIDGLNYEKSEFKKTHDGKPYAVKKFSFQPNIVKNIPIFKVFFWKNIYSTEIFVSQEVKDIVEANGLTGFSFEEVWRDDETDRN